MALQFGLIGVPTSAGAHWPGQEQAPDVLRRAGLVEQLEARGCSVIDHGDLPRVRFQPDREHRHAQNLQAVVEVARSVADRVDAALHAGHVPLVIGGDCTITVGAVSGALRHTGNLALLYIDGGVDLYTPATNPSGILDSMGVAHMIGEPGATRELSHMGPRFPLLTPDRIVYFGYDANTTDGAEDEALRRHGMSNYPADRVRDQATVAAGEALAAVHARGDRFLVHFDVDVIDFVDFPIADDPLFNAGLTLEDALAGLAVFAASPKFGGLVITEFNPDHADEEGVLAAHFAGAVAEALVRFRVMRRN